MKQYRREEKEIEKKILGLLADKHIKAWKTNSGIIFGKDASGRSYAHRMAPPGTSDIIGILPDGKFLAIEVKRPGHEPTELQQGFIGEIKRLGGVAFCAHSKEEARNNLRALFYF